MSNIFLELIGGFTNVFVGVGQFVVLAYLVSVVLKFILDLLRPKQFRMVNTDSFKAWAETCERHRDPAQGSLHISGTRKISTRLVGTIVGFNEVFIDLPSRDRFRKGEDGNKDFKLAMKSYQVEKRNQLDHCYMFAVKKWWEVWKTAKIYLIPTSFIVDDVLVGDILVNTAGFMPVLGNWMIPSNVNRMRYTDVIKTNSIFSAYEKDWDYTGNIAERAVEADNQYLKVKGVRQSVVDVFRKKDKGE